VDNTPSYFARVYSHHKDIAEQDRQNQDEPIDLDRDSTQFVTQKILLKRDRVWASNYFTTGVWSNTDQTGVAAAPGANQFLQWNQAAATPIDDIKNRALQMWSITGFRPNKLVVGPRVYRVLSDHATIVDRIKYSGGVSPGSPAVITPQAIAAILGVDEVVVPGGVVNTAIKGAADAIDFIFGKAALLVYANPSPSILMPSAGYTFLWTGMSGGANGARIKKWWMDEIESDRVEGEMAFDLKAVATDCGQFFTAAIA
jgi:hypothetical protein